MAAVLNTNVCRLCLTANDLLCVFHTKLQGVQDLREVVSVTTGVEICPEDMVSQKICRKCCQISLKMFQFREQSMKNDKYLKERNAKFIGQSHKILQIHVSHTKKQKMNDLVTSNHKIHPSVANIINNFPKIQLPPTCMNWDMAPIVSLSLLAVKSNRIVARKKTTALKSSSEKVVPLKLFPTTLAAETTSKPNKVSPISIKINQEESSYRIVKLTESLAEKSKPTEDASKNPAKSNKRKRSSSDSNAENESKKGAFIKSLGLIPQTKPSVGYSGSTLYIDRERKKHQHKHWRCQFCKAKFKSMEAKEQHIKQSCLIKNMMNNPPFVGLKKIDCERNVRCEYPDAFVGFAPMPSLKRKEKTTLKEFGVWRNKQMHKTSISNAPDDVIEILSDEDEQGQSSDDPNAIATKPDPARTLPTPAKALPTPAKTLPTPAKILPTPAKMIPTAAKILPTAAKILPTPAKILPTPVKILPTPAKILPIPAKILPTPITTEKPPIQILTTFTSTPTIFIPTNPSTIPDQSTPSYIVKPDVKIKNFPFLDKFDPKTTDLTVIKDLLIHITPLRLRANDAIQTHLPPISVNQSEHTAKFTNVKNLLEFYNIPVSVRRGSFKTCYQYVAHPPKQKKLCLWNALDPVDLKMDGNANKVGGDAENKRLMLSVVEGSETMCSSSIPSTSNSSGTIRVPPQSSISLSFLTALSVDQAAATSLGSYCLLSNSSVAKAPPGVKNCDNNSAQPVNEVISAGNDTNASSRLGIRVKDIRELTYCCYKD